MTLGILDRIAVINILPTQGSYLSLLMAKEIRAMLDFTSEEALAAGLNFSETTGASWKKDVPREFTFSDAQTELIRSELARMDSSQELTQDHIGIYQQFIVGASAPALT